MAEINYRLLYEAECNDNKGLTSLNKRLNCLLSAYKVHLDINKKELEAIRKNIDSVYALQKDEKFNAYTPKSFVTFATSKIDFNPNYNYVLILFDLDNFKNVNDTYGHYAGDLAIKSFVDILNTSCRDEIDIVGRFGGDEFVLLMENITLDDANKRIRKVIDIVSLTPVAYSNEGNMDTFNITVSAGVVNYDRSINYDQTELNEVYQSDELTEAEIISRKIYRANFLLADKKLYTAKQYGKNQVVSDENTMLFTKIKTRRLVEKNS